MTFDDIKKGMWFIIFAQNGRPIAGKFTVYRYVVQGVWVYESYRYTPELGGLKLTHYANTVQIGRANYDASMAAGNIWVFDTEKELVANIDKLITLKKV